MLSFLVACLHQCPGWKHFILSLLIVCVVTPEQGFTCNSSSSPDLCDSRSRYCGLHVPMIPAELQGHH